MVVMDRQDYKCKELELLDDKDIYKPILQDPTTKYKSQLINLLKSYKTQGQITKDIYKNASTPKFYGLPKIHKTGTPLRPIVFSRGSITYRVHKEMANILQPLVGASPQHIRNTQHFVEEAKPIQIKQGKPCHHMM